MPMMKSVVLWLFKPQIVSKTPVLVPSRCYHSFEDFYGCQSNLLRKKQQGTRRMITSHDLAIPSNEIRQFIKLVHPDTLEKYHGNYNNGLCDKNLMAMKETNAKSLSSLHAILEFSKKYSKIYSKMIDTNSNRAIVDSLLPENGPPPMTLQFYVEKENGNTNRNKILSFDHITVMFDCKQDKPMISQFFESFRLTMRNLFEQVDIDTNNIASGNDRKVLKFSQLEMDDAMNKNGNKSRNENDEINLIFSQYVNDLHDYNKVNEKQMQGVANIKYKFDKNKVKFHTNLTENQKTIATDTLFEASQCYANDLVFHLWIDIPIVIVENELQCLQCPNHVVAMPWYFDKTTLLLFVQENIMMVKDNYEKAVQKRLNTAKTD